MDDFSSKGNCTPLPLSALKLLVPPIRLVSAVIWKTIQQKVVADYGMLEEFVSMVTDILPKLLTTHQRAQLILGLRSRLILELCQFDVTADVDLVQPHLDRVQTFIDAWVMEVGASNMEVPQSQFVDLVKSLLKNPDEREHFFQSIFPEEFGPTYDEALHTLMWMFLSRLERFLPLQTFQQVSTMLGEESSVLEECMMSQHEELKTLLQYQKDLNQLDHNDGSLDGDCIISALKLPPLERTETDKKQQQANIMNNLLSFTSDLDNVSFTSPHALHVKTDTITEDPRGETKVDETNWTFGENGTAELLGGITRHKENVGRLRSEVQNTPCSLKHCSVQLKRLDMPSSLQCRPVRRNRGLRLKKILLHEKGDLRADTLVDNKSASSKKRPCRDITQGKEDPSSFVIDSFMSPISDCSDDDSCLTNCSSEDSCNKTTSCIPTMADSWSNCLDDECSFVTRVRSKSEIVSLFGCSKENPSFICPKNVSATIRKKGISDGALRKTRTFHCLICKEHVNTSGRTHMKTHFPTGDFACPRCDSRFKLYSSFKLHLNRTCFEFSQLQVDSEKPHETKNLYKCDKCEEAFRYKVGLERHKLTHDKLYCIVCRKVLQNAASLARHKASHTLFQCNRCEETFMLFKPLLRHCQNVHKITRPFKCNHCPKTFSKLRVLIAHEWKHMGHLPFQCTHCSLRFRNDGDLIAHERVHTREKPYLCSDCGRTFSHKSNLLRHLNLIHSESRNEKKHSCSECEKSFKEKGALKKHQRTKHLNELFRHPCPYCGKMISSSTIARHKLIHTGERPFKCTEPDCDKDFRSTAEVKRHVLMHHTAERPYKCDVCGKGFIKLCILRAHAKIHSGEKPFVCHICGKAFLKLYSMQRHKKLIHTVL